MTGARGTMTAAAYAMFALQQPLTLDQLADATDSNAFPLASTETPEWFSAAGSAGSSLVDTAPELALTRPDESDDRLDLVRMYAPELSATAEPAGDPAPEQRSADSDDALGLLRELDHLEP